MYHILLAHVISDSIDLSLLDENQVVELEISVFLERLNTLSSAYKRTFQYEDESQVDEKHIRELVQLSEFSRFVKFENEKLKIDVTPQKFQAQLTGIIVDSSIKHSKVLAREVNELTEKYLEIRPPVPQIAVQPENPEKTGNPEHNAVKTELAKTEQDSAEEAVKETENEEIDGNQDEADAMDVDGRDSLGVVGEESEEVEIEETKEETEEPENDEAMNSKEDGDLEEESPVTEITVAEAAEETEETEESEQTTKEKTEEESEDPETSEETPAHTPQSKSNDEILTSSHTEKSPRVKFSETPEPELRSSTADRPKRSMSPLITQKHKRFQNIAINLVKTIEEHRFSSPFLTPVQADEYEEVVYHPKDLKSILKAIKQKLEPAPYETIKELERDIMLMFANCVMYNKSNAHLVDMAKQMRDDVRNTFKMFEEAESEIAK